MFLYQYAGTVGTCLYQNDLRTDRTSPVPARSIQQMRPRANAVLHLAVLCCAAAFARATEAGEEDLPARDPRKVDDKEIVTAAKVCFRSTLLRALLVSAVVLGSVANTRSPVHLPNA